MTLAGFMSVVPASEYIVVPSHFRRRNRNNFRFTSVSILAIRSRPSRSDVQSNLLVSAVSTLTCVLWEGDDGVTFALYVESVVCAIRLRLG